MLLGGLVVLALGAELLVRGASRFAAAAGISPLVIGLTVVAYGTSTPELAVSVLAGLAGQPEIAVANVVGSNIANVFLILGVCSLALPLTVSRQLVRSEVPILIGASLIAWWMLRDGRITWLDGFLLTALALIYTFWTIRQSRRDAARERAAQPLPEGTERAKMRLSAVLAQVAMVVAGLGLLVLGSHGLVTAATTLAKAFGISDVVVGLTVVAVGTSLPEMATSLAATFRGQRDIAIGNAVGSSIYNLLMILGVAGLATPGGLVVAPALANFDVPVMVAAAAVCLPVFFTGYTISRLEGALFLGGYVAYTAYLVLAATHHDSLPEFSVVMLLYVLPTVALLLAISLLRALVPTRG